MKNANRAAHRENQAVSKIPDEVVFKQYLFVGFKGDAGGNGNKAFQKIAPGFYRIHQRHHGDKDRNAGIDNQKNRDRPAEDFPCLESTSFPPLLSLSCNFFTLIKCPS